MTWSAILLTLPLGKDSEPGIKLLSSVSGLADSVLLSSLLKNRFSMFVTEFTLDMESTRQQ